MSRTDKDRPYWVKVQDEGVETHYHHSSHYGRRARVKIIDVLDAEGNPVMEEHVVKMSAKRVLETQDRMKKSPYTVETYAWSIQQGFYTRIYEGISQKIANPVYSEAERLVALGMPDAMVILRTEMRKKTERIVLPAPEECDYDPDTKGRANYWKSNCGKELPYWRAGYSCRCSWCKPGDEPRQRTRERNFLHEMRKAANSGVDGWEDGFNELDLSKPDRYHRGWC